MGVKSNNKKTENRKRRYTIEEKAQRVFKKTKDNWYPNYNED